MKYDFSKLERDNTVYVRQVAISDLPEDVQDKLDGQQMIYALHRAEDGERLALVKERAMAFTLARQNDMAPVAVH